MLLIVDPFAGREPQRVDAAAAAGAEALIGFRPTLVLDSQTVTYLHQYVSGSMRLSPPCRRIVEELLRFAITMGLDYNPAFYFLEALRRGDDAAAEYAASTAYSILRLHTMNTETFLRTGRIVIDPHALAHYEAEFGVNTFDDVASAYAKRFVRDARGRDLAADGTGRLTYAVLLAIAAIHRRRPATARGDILCKCAQLDQCIGTLGIGLAFERFVAILCFAGLIDSFLPVQKGANPDRALTRIRAAVWDIEFLRVPAIWIALPPEHGVFVSYPCTADHTLALAAQSITLEFVCVSPGGRPIFPSYAFRDKEMRRFVVQGGVFRPPPSRSAELGEAELLKLIQEGEAAVRQACEA